MTADTAPDLAQRVLLACPLDSRQSVRALATRFEVPAPEIGAVLDYLRDNGLIEFVGDELCLTEFGALVTASDKDTEPTDA